jgi:beta-galactosidase
MQKVSFNADWCFFLGDPAFEILFDAENAAWRHLELPHDWSIELDRDPAAPSTVSGGFFPMGRAWYAKTIEAPEAWRGKKVLVEFEGVYMNAEVWLNENLLGRHPYGYTSFCYDLAPYLKIGQKNLLRVMVDNAAQMNSRWYSGSGIYRPTWLWLADQLHIAHWGVWAATPRVSADTALVEAHTKIENESSAAQEITLRSAIFTAQGTKVADAVSMQKIAAGATLTLTQEMNVAKPALWSPDSPSMYTLKTEVSAGGEIVDTLETPIGMRSIAVNAQHGFLLNGQPLKLKGGCVHHDNGVMGAASYPDSEERKVALHKASGFNAIRTAHNPPAPAFLDACDRLGILVMDEAFDCWRTGKNPYDYHVVFEDWWARDIASMVERDRNHPSVVLWSIGNEVYERDGRSNGEQIARMLAEGIRASDTTRPISSAICGIWGNDHTWIETDVVFSSLDVGGYNYQWSEYIPDHLRHPERVMSGTESFPLEAFENWMSVLDHSYVIGDFVWTSMDYLGESGIGRQHYEPESKDFLGKFPWHQAYCGDIDLAGFKRPQSYYRDVVWGNGDPLYIAVHYPIPAGKTAMISRWGWPDVDASWNWSGHEGETFKVDVYSAAEKVELFLNGKSLGEKLTTRAEKLMATFEVPYAAGELKVVGTLADGQLVSKVLCTTGAPAGIRLNVERPNLVADPLSLCFVTVKVVDGAGQMDPTAAHEIHFRVEGAGELAAVGSGNPVSEERYRGSQRKAHRGCCVAVVKSNGKPGTIRLYAEADGLESAESIIQVD